MAVSLQLAQPLCGNSMPECWNCECGVARARPPHTAITACLQMLHNMIQKEHERRREVTAQLQEEMALKDQRDAAEKEAAEEREMADMIADKKLKAAIKIQSAYRGWKVSASAYLYLPAVSLLPYLSNAMVAVLCCKLKGQPRCLHIMHTAVLPLHM